MYVHVYDMWYVCVWYVVYVCMMLVCGMGVCMCMMCGVRHGYLCTMGSMGRLGVGFVSIHCMNPEDRTQIVRFAVSIFTG